MPLPKRVVDPLFVSRGTLPKDVSVDNELEAATNGTLATVVRQMSSLSRHAEDMFGELCRETQVIVSRTTNLQQRIKRIAVKVTQLDSTVEEVSLQDIQLRKAFRSTVVNDQQVVSRDSLPSAMLETYHSCSKPPPLDKLNPYREDGKNGVKFYTDPNYFFDLWRQEMLKDAEKIMQDKKKPGKPRAEGRGRHKKQVRQPHNTREELKKKAVAQGEIYVSNTQIQQQNRLTRNHSQGYQDMCIEVDSSKPARPNSIELQRSHSEAGESTHYPPPYAAVGYPNYPPPPYSPEPSQPQTPTRIRSQINHTITSNNSNNRPSQPPPAPPTPGSSTPTRRGRESLPPPPPPPATLPQHVFSPPSSHHGSRNGTPTHQAQTVYNNKPEPEPPAPVEPVAPPPPPPPPPPEGGSSALPNGLPNVGMANGDIGKSCMSEIITSAKLSPPKTQESSQPDDARSDLLKAIRDGIKLRKVEEMSRKEVERTAPLHDVASILARRVQIEFSDSESESSECDSETWEEENST